MNIQLYRTPAVFEELAAEWDGLLASDSSTNLFSSLGWNRLWWQYLGRGELLVLALRDSQGTLQGIAPWFIETDAGKQVVRFIGSHEVVDYLDFVLAPGYEIAGLNAICHFMLETAEVAWDIIDLYNLPADSVTRKYFLSTPLPLELVHNDTEDVCPIITLADDYEGYLSSIDKKNRHELRRKRRKAESFEATWRKSSDIDGLEGDLATFIELMSLSTNDKAAFLMMPGHVEFLKAIAHYEAERGHLEILFAGVGEKPVAAMLQFAYRDRIMLYNSGLDSSSEYAGLSIGIVLLTYSIEDAIARGFKYFDFLRGDEIYKLRMGAHETHIYRMSLEKKA